MVTGYIIAIIIAVIGIIFLVAAIIDSDEDIAAFAVFLWVVAAIVAGVTWGLCTSANDARMVQAENRTYHKLFPRVISIDNSFDDTIIFQGKDKEVYTILHTADGKYYELVNPSKYKK